MSEISVENIVENTHVGEKDCWMREMAAVDYGARVESCDE